MRVRADLGLGRLLQLEERLLQRRVDALLDRREVEVDLAQLLVHLGERGADRGAPRAERAVVASRLVEAVAERRI